MPLVTGQTVSFYEILGPLGAGGMGEVYRARDTKLEREVAIKVLPEELAGDEERLRRFEREAKTLAALNHTNVAGIYGVDQVEDVCFLALEFVPGEDLAQRLARGPLALDEALDVCRQIAAGLEAAHAAGIVHRDLKPANVRITPGGAAKVLDFGLAKDLQPRGAREARAADPDSLLMTQAGVVLGTPTYMSPEQARGRAVDLRTDVWAFGCVLYECLTGARAFDGGSFSELVASILERDVEYGRLPAQTPPAVRKLLRQTLEKDPDKRLADIGEAREVLARIAADAEVARRRGGWLQSLAAIVLAVVVGAWVFDRLDGWFGGGDDEPRSMEVLPALDPRTSIAVLPFSNWSGDEQNRYFSDGISEEVLNLLAKLGSLRVASRTSSFALRDEILDVPAIAERLGVEHIVDGSVRRSGDTVRVIVQLVDAATDTLLWSETYDRELEDIFAVQDDIAGKIAAALHLTLAPGERVTRDEPETDIVAYELYLHGRYLWHQRGEANLREAIRLFEQAVEEDPGFARGWSALASAWSNLPVYSNVSNEEAFGVAERHARRALNLERDQVEALLVFALLELYRWNWSRATELFERAIGADPGNPTAVMWYGELCHRLGYLRRARELFDRGLLLDPAYPPLFTNSASVDLSLGEWERARPHARAGSTLGNPFGPFIEAWVAMEGGDIETVRERMNVFFTSLGLEEGASRLLVDGWVDATARGPALEVVDGLRARIEEGRLGAVHGLVVVELYARLGDLDRLFDFLDRHQTHGQTYTEVVFWGPAHRAVRQDPRFEALVRRSGMYDHWSEHGWPDECSASAAGMRCD